MFPSHRRNTRQVKVGGRRDYGYLFLVIFWREAKTHAKRFELKPSYKEREINGGYDTEVRCNAVGGVNGNLLQACAAQ